MRFSSTMMAVAILCFPARGQSGEPPTFTRHPQSAAVRAGSTLVLQAAAASTTTISWQWYKDRLPLAGAIEETLTLYNCGEAATGEYHAVATNAFGGHWSLAATVVVLGEQAAAGYVDATFDDAGISGGVTAIAPLPGGNWLVAGDFQNARLVPGLHKLARLMPSGLPDDSFRQGDPGPVGNIYAIATQGMASFVAGDFTVFDGLSASGLVKLDEHGRRDAGFVPELPTGAQDVRCLAATADGKLYVGGRSRVATTTTDWLVRLNANGSRDFTFAPPSIFNGRVRSIALRTDGKLWVGGNFFRPSGNSAFYNRIVLLRSTGAVDSAFLPPAGTESGANLEVRSVLAASDGGAFLGGLFTRINGATRYGLAKVQSNGALVTGFSAPIPDDVPTALAEDAHGSLYVGGDISRWGASSLRSVAKFLPDGALDSTWQPAGLNGAVSALHLSQGRLLVAGQFTLPHSGVLKLGTSAREVVPRTSAALPAMLTTGLFRPQQVLSSINGPIALPDTGDRTWTFAVTSSGNVQEVRLWWDASHADASTVTLRLEPPASHVLSPVMLVSSGSLRHGKGFQRLCFSSHAPFHLLEAPPPFTGTYRPEGELGLSAGKPAAGSWKVHYTDTKADGLAGVLSSVVLEIITQATPATYATYVAMHPGTASFEQFAFGQPSRTSPPLAIQRLGSQFKLTHPCWPLDTPSQFQYWHSTDLQNWLRIQPSCRKWITPDAAWMEIYLTPPMGGAHFWRVSTSRGSGM